MRFGTSVPAFADFSDPRVLAELAHDAEAAGQPFSYQGEQYNVKVVTFRPSPVQSPRIPIWVGGWWPNKPPLRRAARWDGVCPIKGWDTITPDEWRELLAYVQKYRTSDTPFDAVHSGATPGDDLPQAAEMVKPYEDIGVT